MGYYTGAGKYFVMSMLFNPFNLYIYGGTLLWLKDWLDLFHSDDINEFAVNYILLHYGIPNSIGDAFGQLLVGAVFATISWLIASLRYARSQGG